MSDQETKAREWWPAAWADEIMPPGRPSPNDFVICADGHWFLGYAFDARDVSDYDKRYFSKAINSGDVVKFLCCDPLGNIDVTINPDGTYSHLEFVPERATHFWEAGDADTLAGTIAEFVEQYLQVDAIKVPQVVTVAMAWWSEGIPHKLTVTYDGSSPHGKAAFVQVSEAEATQ